MPAETAAAETTATASHTLRLTRRFAAPRERVFRAWTDPEALRRWCAPHGFSVPLAEGELRPDGPWRSTMRGPDGQEYALVGRYREIAPPERLVFTHAWIDESGRRGVETLVTVTFEADGAETILTLVQSGFDTAASRDGHRGGWSECLERLDAHLASAG